MLTKYAAGELSLEFPEASRKLRGGILADEMGLGKTIMVAALIHTNVPTSSNRKRSRDDHTPTGSSSSEEPDTDDDASDTPYIPSPVRRNKQATLLPTTNGAKGLGNGGRHAATLVVAPTSLLNQWRDELIRASNGAMSVLVYNDQKDTSTLMDDLEGGVDVVVASYGKIGVEYEKHGGDDKIAKPARKGLYAVEWYRIILDEVGVCISVSQHER